MSILLGKLLVAVAVVLGLSWIAEHVNARIAGVVSGMPLGAFMVFSFVGLELGPGFVAESARFAIPSLIATVAFAFGYVFGSGMGRRFAPLSASVMGLAGYFVIAVPLSWIDLGLWPALGLTLPFLIVVAYLARSKETSRIRERVPMTLPRLLFRAGLASGTVVAIAAFADLVGPQWSGLLVGFPMTFLPFLLVIHITYSADQVRTIVRNFPMGLVSLLSFFVIIATLMPRLGLGLGMAAGMGAALAYLIVLATLLGRSRPG